MLGIGDILARPCDSPSAGIRQYGERRRVGGLMRFVGFVPITLAFGVGAGERFHGGGCLAEAARAEGESLLELNPWAQAQPLPHDWRVKGTTYATETRRMDTEHRTYLKVDVDASGDPVAWQAACQCGWQGWPNVVADVARNEALQHHPQGVGDRLKVSWPGKPSI